MAVPGVAWGLLPGRPAAAPRAGIRRGAADLDRGQRLVLLPPATVVVRRVARPDTGRLRVRGEGWPVRHAHEAAQGRRRPARQLLRLRCAGARAEARSRAVAAPREPP